VKTYDSIIFDLDGTLWNACEACARGWTTGLSTLNYNKTVSKKDIENICGLTYDEIMDELFSDSSIDKETIKNALNKYERLEVEKSGGDLFDGVSFLIPQLRKQFDLYIVSNCQEWYLEVFLNHSGLKENFNDWESHGKTGLKKFENINSVIKRNNLKKTIYIGDTPGDLEAAKKADIDFLYAQYGFQEFNYTPFVHSFKELADYFLSTSI